MHTAVLRLAGRAPISFHCVRPAGVRHYASNRSSSYNEAELSAARKWLAALDPETIPEKLCDISFSRSSGPGGQKVNKTSSKATLRLSTSTLLKLVPTPLHESILASRYYAKSSGDIVIQNDTTRSQADNALACRSKLLDLIREASEESVPGETSAEQLEKVARLQKAEAEGRRRIKEHQSKKKSARRGGGRGDD